MSTTRFQPRTSVSSGTRILPSAGTRQIRPADKAYGRKVPDDFRLDIEGRIFCLTCHKAHGPFLSPTRAYAAQKPANPGAPAGTKPAYRTYYTRRSDPERGFVVLCEACHGKQ